MRGDFILVVCNMMNRILSFQSGIIKAKSRKNDQSLAERISTLSPEEIKEAVEYKDLNNTNANTSAGNFLQAVSTCCRSIAYSPEAAKHHRRRYLALAAHLGLKRTFFLTMSPCDECSFRVRLFARAGVEVSKNPILSCARLG